MSCADVSEPDAGGSMASIGRTSGPIGRASEFRGRASGSIGRASEFRGRASGSRGRPSGSANEAGASVVRLSSLQQRPREPTAALGSTDVLSTSMLETRSCTRDCMHSKRNIARLLNMECEWGRVSVPCVLFSR